MNRFKRVLVIFLTAVLMISAMDVSFADQQANSTKSPKKIVAVLYDDSGSMQQNGNTNWFYADYAFQIFTGLLNPDDELMVTFMSDPGKVIKSNSPGLLESFSEDRQKTVDAIRDYKGKGNTPFQAVKDVGDTLSSVQDDDPSTQYWFVIIADGSFELKPDEEWASQSELDSAISEHFTSKTMPNGSQGHVIFMAIDNPDEEKDKDDNGKEPPRIYPTENEYVQLEHCTGEGIVDVMGEMADTITGRYRVDPADITVNGKEITISSPLPLLNIQVLAQNSDAKVTSAKASEGADLTASSISMATPKGDSGRKEGKELHGTLSTVQPKGDYISAGTYTLTLDKETDPKDIVVMYEVAAQTRLTFTRKGKVVKDTAALRENERVDIEVDLVIAGTEERIDVTTLPEGVFEGMSLTVEENGVTVVSENIKKGDPSVIKKDYKITGAETVVTGETRLRGFAPLITKETFTPKEPVVYGVQADGNELTVRRGYIHGREGSVDFTVTGDGEPLDKVDVESLIDKDSIKITCNGKKTGVKFRYEIGKDGKLHVYPKTSLLNNAFAFIKVPKGEYDVTVSLDEETSATGHFTVKGYPPLGVIISLIVLALILLFIYLLTKPHFPAGTLYRTQYSIDYKGNFRYDGTARMQTGYWTKFFTLTGPRRITFSGVELEVIQNNRMHVTAKWIAAHQSKKNGRDYFCTISKPDPNLSTKAKEAAVKKEYAALVNAQPAPKWPSGKNKLFDTSGALLAILAPQTVNTYQFTKRGAGRGGAKAAKKKAGKGKGKK